MDITYLIFVSFECFFVLHGTLWHDVPIAWCTHNEEDNCIHSDILVKSRHQNNHLPGTKSNFETDPFLSYHWRKYASKSVTFYRIFLKAENVALGTESTVNSDSF